MRSCLCVRRSGFWSDAGHTGRELILRRLLFGVRDVWRTGVLGRAALLAIGQSLCYDKAKNAEERDL